MNRRILALGAVIVLVAIGGLLFALRGSHDGERDDARSVAPQRDTTHRDEARPRSAEPESGRRTPAPPVPPSADDTATPDGGSPFKEYVVGDVRMRDHRSGDHPQRDVAPAVHPPLGRRLPSTLTNEFAQQLRAALATCAVGVPAEARGPAAKIDGEIIIAIKDERASITAATFQPRDITGEANDAVKQCLASKAIGMATPSGDQADLDHYAVTLSLVLP
ncbi:MAG: hypothetical protein ABIY55_11170 [Kofleriaceae bacterium]